MNITEYIEQHKITEQSTEEARKSLFGKASMFFFDKESGDCRSVFADVECETELPNPLQADAAGNFPAFHFLPDTKSSYTIEIQDTRAKSIMKGGVSDSAKAEEVTE